MTVQSLMWDSYNNGAGAAPYPYGSELIEYHREGLEEWKDAIMELN